jgi:hypothetical protein
MQFVNCAKQLYCATKLNRTLHRKKAEIMPHIWKKSDVIIWLKILN